MVDLQTDEEKAEAIKKWWKENGIAVVTGVAIGLAAIFGWRGWMSYQEQRGQQASLAFEELLMTTDQLASMPPLATTATNTDAPPDNDNPKDNPDAARENAANPLLTIAAEQQARLTEEFGATAYAYFGQLALAKAYNDQGQLEPAAQALRAAIGQAPTPLLETLAGLRLARVLLAAGDQAGASAVIDQYDTAGGSFAADFAALRGDIAWADGRVEDARAAYNQALEGDPAAAGLVRLKLQDLPVPSEG